jgi:TonB family protein
MKKIFFLIVIVPSIFFNTCSHIKAQTKVEERYYSPELLDGIKNAKATMFKDKKSSIELQKKLFAVFNFTNIYDGSKQVSVIVNYNLLIDENGKLVKLIPVDQLPHDGSKWGGKNLIINPKEATDIITREVRKAEFKLGKKEGKPVKYSYFFTCALTAAPSNTRNKKQPEIVVDGDEYYKSLEKFPNPIRMNKPEYPEVAKKAGIQGKVMVRTLVDEKGNVVRAEVAKGIGFGCDEAAVKAVKATKFNPGILKGSPVKVEIIIPIEFKLDK